MLDFVNELISSIMGSPWVYLAIFLVCTTDAFFPVVPSETSVIAAAAVAASGEANVWWVAAVALLGALFGDQISYGIGRSLGRSGAERVLRGDKGKAAREWGERMLRVRGGLVIVALRFIPFGRTATTLAAGTLNYPFRRFVAFAALAAAAWATYASLIGYWAGGVFEGNHLLAVTVGIGISVVISVVVESGRWFLRRRRGLGDPGEERREPYDRVTGGFGSGRDGLAALGDDVDWPDVSGRVS